VASDRHPYGGDHHRLSLIDQLGTRVERGLHADPDDRDPAFLGRLHPLVDLMLRYYDPVVEGFDRLPAEGPFLVVGNHSGGFYMPDFWAFLSRWLHERGTGAPLYSLGFDFLYSIPGWSAMARRMGTVPASQANASTLLSSGAPVIVYPGGDFEDYRPWTERHRVELAGHTGFVQLALRHGVPVFPLVSHGSHETIIVVSRGERLARVLGFDRLRIGVMPIVAGLPWGIAPVQLPTWPLPTKVTARVCEPFDWSGLGPDAADDPDVVRACYDEVEARMQANLDDLVARLPHPVLERVRTATGLDRIIGRR
jgi:1-acyl-sn-glycerol-3-phosphate acyltransferase